MNRGLLFPWGFLSLSQFLTGLILQDYFFFFFFSLFADFACDFSNSPTSLSSALWNPASLRTSRFLFAAEPPWACVASRNRDTPMGTDFVIGDDSEMTVWSLCSLPLTMRQRFSLGLRLQGPSLLPSTFQIAEVLRDKRLLPQVPWPESVRPQKAQWEEDHERQVVPRDLQRT